MKTRNRLLSLMLAFCMVLTLFPSTALADDTVQAEPGTVISTDGYYTSLIDENGILWTWGDSIYNDNQLGNGTTGGSNAPVKVIENAVSVVREKQFSEGSNAVITSDGSLWMWGQNRWGQLGIGTCESSSVPVKVLDNVASVSLGGMRTAAVKTDGSLWTWGNAQGSVWAMLGNGTEEGSLVPIKVMDGVASVSCGAQHIAALKTDGSLWLWGDGSALGRGDITDLAKDEPWHSPVPIKIMDNVAHVCAGNTATVVIKTDGSLWAWGSDDYGILGDGLTDHAYWPVKVMDNVSSVTLYKGTGYPAVAAIKNDGSLWMWGSNNCGRLGNGITQDSHIPVKILDDVASVSVGVSHTAAIKKDGSLWTWGWNRYGQLGTGTSQDSLIPVKVMDNAAVVALEVNNTFVGKTDRTVWVFGANTSGTLGLGFAGNSINVPTQNESLTVKVPGPVTPPGPGVDPDPGPDTPPEPTGSAAITALYPANGTTFDFANASSDTRMRIFFDREVSDGGGGRPELDFSVGTLEVHKASDNSVVYQMQYGTEVSLWNVDGRPTAVVLKNATAALDYDTEYYVTMPEGFIKMADGSVSPAVENSDWMFVTSYNAAVSFTYASSAGGDATYAGLSFRNSWFFEDSNKYNHDLAMMTLGLVMSGFGSNAHPNYPDINIKNLYSDLSFDTRTYYSIGYDVEDNDSVAIAMCSKKIVDENGNNATLLAICLRGQGYGNGGWAGNFDVSTASTYGVYHAGFYKAATYARKQIQQYIEDNNINTNKMKIWLTGYSRAAATANLLSIQLRTNHICSGSNIYTYTFATPNNQVITSANSSYNNIFNIINPNDIVPTIPLTKWNFGKLGTSYILPSLRDNNLNPQYDWVSDKFSSIIGNFATYNGKVSTVAMRMWLIDEVGKAVPTRDIYCGYLEEMLIKACSSDPTAINSAFSSIFYGTITPNEFNELVELVQNKRFASLAVRLNDLSEKIQVSAPAQSLLTSIRDLALGAAEELSGRRNGSHNTNIIIALFDTFSEGVMQSDLIKEHWAEVYLAWMTSIKKEDLVLAGQYNSKMLMAKCPIDVNVYDASGNLVAQVIDDSVQEITDSNISVAVLGKSDKVFVFPSDQVYQVELIATGDGTMEYSITENYADGTVFRDVEFYSIAIENGDIFCGAIDNVKNTNIVNYALTKNDTDKIYADFDSNNSSNVDPTAPVAPTPSYPIGGNASGNSVSTIYSITIPTATGGSVTVIPKSASRGNIVTLTIMPDEGYDLISLTVTDNTGNELELTNKGGGKYTFVMPDSKVTVAAVFQLIQQDDSQHPQDPSWINPFTDVSESSWYYDAVRFVNENSLMNGISSTTFAPDANLSRAQLAQILYNKEGKPAVSDSSPFTDVAAGVWYSDAVIWAAANSIVGGYGNGLFGPDDNITREQLAVMLWRYAGEPVANIEIAFNDADQISDFAQAAIRWAVENGILSGKGNNILDPKGYATRAEVAQMLKNYLG